MKKANTQGTLQIGHNLIASLCKEADENRQRKKYIETAIKSSKDLNLLKRLFEEVAWIKTRQLEIRKIAISNKEHMLLDYYSLEFLFEIIKRSLAK